MRYAIVTARLNQFNALYYEVVGGDIAALVFENGCHFTFWADNYDSLAKRLKRKGVELVSDIQIELEAAFERSGGDKAEFLRLCEGVFPY